MIWLAVKGADDIKRVQWIQNKTQTVFQSDIFFKTTSFKISIIQMFLIEV